MFAETAASAADLVAARQQMALSLGWHIVLACLGVGFPVLLLIAEGRALRTGDERYRALAKRWSKAFAVLFAVGAVSGTILSLELGVLWPGLMEQYGDVIGLPFAMEGIAFFLEAIFVGIYLYGWDRLPPKLHWWSGVPIALSGIASAVFVVSANAWMNQPRGFTIAPDGSITDVDPVAAMLNPAFFPEAFHLVLAALMVTGFLVATIHAWRLLRRRATEYDRLAFRIAFALGAVVAPVQIFAGDIAARFIAENQPLKLAALEGLEETQANAPFSVAGVIEIPSLLSLLAHHDPDAVVIGLDSAPPDERPPLIPLLRISFQLMVAIGTGLTALAGWYGWSWWRKRRPPSSAWFWRAAVIAGPASVVALEAGWIVTEVGRQPWIVYGILRTTDAVTQANNIRYGYYGLIVVYIGLTAATVFALRRLVPPTPDAELLGPQDER